MRKLIRAESQVSFHVKRSFKLTDRNENQIVNFWWNSQYQTSRKSI